MKRLFRKIQILALRFREGGDRMGFGGYLERRILRADGTIEVLPTIKNLVLNAGIAQAMLLLGDGTAAVFAYGAIGTGTTAAAVTDVALETEIDRQAATFSREQTALANDTGKWVSTHTAPAGGWSPTEYALLTATPTGGVALTRVVYAAVVLAENDQLEFTYKNQGQKV